MKISAVLKKSALQAWTPKLEEGGGSAFEFTAGQVYDGGEGSAVVTANSLVTTTGFAAAQGPVSGLSSAAGKIGIYYKLTNVDIESMPNDSDLASYSGFIPAGFNLATQEFPDFGLCAVVGLNKGPMGVVTKTLLEISDPFGSTFSTSIDEEITVDSDTEFCLAFDKDAGTYGTVYFYTSEMPDTPWSYEFTASHAPLANFMAYPNGTSGASIGIEIIASPSVEHAGVTNASGEQDAFDPTSVPEDCAGKLYQITDLVSPIIINGKLYKNADVVWFDLESNFRGHAFRGDYLTLSQANSLFMAATAAEGFAPKVKNNLTAMGAPTTDNNDSEGYADTSRWVDNSVSPKECYVLVEASAGYWVKTSFTLDELGGMAMRTAGADSDEFSTNSENDSRYVAQEFGKGLYPSFAEVYSLPEKAKLASLTPSDIVEKKLFGSNALTFGTVIKTHYLVNTAANGTNSGAPDFYLPETPAPQVGDWLRITTGWVGYASYEHIIARSRTSNIVLASDAAYPTLPTPANAVNLQRGKTYFIVHDGDNWLIDQ